MINYRLTLCVFGCILLTSCATFFQTINYSPSSKIKKLYFTRESPNLDVEFYYSDTTNHEYLRALRKCYGLDTLVSNSKSQLSKVGIILNWANQQWEHNGSNTPSRSDALTILKEASNGNKFRCVEYGIVSAAALNSINIPARVLGLKTSDVERVKRGAGHVVAEAYLNDLQKWVFIDGQHNVIPVLNGMPLNAIEFQNAIIQHRNELDLINRRGNLADESKEAYLSWIGKYLFYFDVTFDQRICADKQLVEIKGKNKLTLVPMGAKEPVLFQRRKIDYGAYTNSLTDFYQKP